MSTLHHGVFFDLDGFGHSAAFPPEGPVWSALGDVLKEYMGAWNR